MRSRTVSWVGPIITVNFPTVAILNGQFGYVLNFPTHGPHERVWTYKLVCKSPRPLSGRQAQPSSSLSLTLVSFQTLESCVCLDLTWVHTLGVLDDGLSSSVISWHFSILTLSWSDGRHLRSAPWLSCVWGSQLNFS